MNAGLLIQLVFFGLLFLGFLRKLLIKTDSRNDKYDVCMASSVL